MRHMSLKATIVSLILISLIGCGTYESRVHTSSEGELASLYDATKDKRVELCFQDTATGRVEYVTTTDLIVNMEAASWTGPKGGMETIRTDQIISVTCADCKTKVEGGVLIGGLVGAGTGLVFGLGIDAVVSTSDALHDQSTEPLTNPTSIVPISMLIGAVAGGVVGGVSGSSSTRQIIWTFQP